MAKDKIKILKEEIVDFETAINNPDTIEDEKELFREELPKMKAELEKLEKEKPEKKAPKKPKKKEPKKRPPKMVDVEELTLEECKKLLKQYTEKRVKAKKKAKARRKKGIPAALTTAEVVKKNAEKVEKKIQKLHKRKKKITKSDTDQIKKSIRQVVNLVASAIKTRDDGVRFVKDLIKELENLIKGKMAKGGEVKLFIKKMKDSKGHILDKVVTAKGDTMIYYREYGSYPTDVKRKVFYAKDGKIEKNLKT